MKNNTKHLLFLSTMLLIASAFVNHPATPASPAGGAYLVFAGKFGGEISKEEIARHNILEVDGCAHGSRIFKYTLQITKSGKTSTFSNNSNILTAEMHRHLKNLSKGDVFEFHNTKAYLPNGKEQVDVHGKRFIVV